MSEKSSNGRWWNANTIFLGAVLGVGGFCGVQLWGINARLAVVESTLNTLTGLQPRIEALELSQARHWPAGDGK